MVNGTDAHAFTSATEYTEARGLYKNGRVPVPTPLEMRLRRPSWSIRNLQMLPFTTGGSDHTKTIKASRNPENRPPPRSTMAAATPPPMPTRNTKATKIRVWTTDCQKTGEETAFL